MALRSESSVRRLVAVSGWSLPSKILWITQAALYNGSASSRCPMSQWSEARLLKLSAVSRCSFPSFATLISKASLNNGSA